MRYKKYPNILLAIKCIFFLALSILAGNKMGYGYTAFALLEGIAIMFFGGSIKNNGARYIINLIGSIFLGAQLLILIFGRTFLTLVMLANLDSIEDLSGNSTLYISSAIVLIVVSLLPMKKLKFKRISCSAVLSCVLCVELVLVMCVGSSRSPLYGYISLVQQHRDQVQLQRKLETMKASAEEFYSGEITDYYKKREDLPDKPNVVILFTEGLSQSIVDDKRELMPNVKKYEKMSLRFKNYFNHTFATYRGLIGQLYSGYQLNNYDTNRFISLQDIFKGEGYNTTFINTEPHNASFTAYLEKMNFDSLFTDSEVATSQAKSIADRVAYEKLYDLMEKKSEEEQPYLIAMYTLGTHISFNSEDAVWGDGSDAELNKFYNLDVQFGEFMRKFEESQMSENTIIVFTTDHCTYVDDAFDNSFPDVERASVEVDEIPFFIYYKGMKKKTVNVVGRNSLDFAPTLCDYLDISAENYFLGRSLFEGKDSISNYNTVFNQSADYFSTRGGSVNEINSAELEIVSEGIERYFAVSRQ